MGLSESSDELGLGVEAFSWNVVAVLLVLGTVVSSGV